MPNEKTLHFHTIGRFRVSGPRGENLTPRGQRPCALLALLLSDKDFERSRAYLQDKLWSDRSPEQGSASLRNALSDVRRAFGDYRDVLVSEGRMVGLAEGSFTTDLTECGAGESDKFLEGLDIRDPEFEGWLRDRRNELRDAVVGVACLGRTPADVAPVLLVETPTGQSRENVFGEYVAQAISKGVSDWGRVDIRWSPAAMPVGKEPAYRLTVAEQRIGDGVTLRVQLSMTDNPRIIWQCAELIPICDARLGQYDIARIVSSCIDQTLAALAERRSAGGTTSQVAQYFTEMQAMFRTQGANYDRHYEAFGKRFDQDHRGIHLAWQGFLACWAVGERHERDLADVRENARALMRRAIEIEPHNALVLALASYIFGFVLGEYDVAFELARRSTRLDRNNPLGWALLSVAEVNLGKLDDAFDHVMLARRISGDGPHTAFIDSVAVQVGTLVGKATDVVPIGETLHVLRPDYAAPLRYLLAGYLSAREFGRAEMTLLRLRKLEPDFDVSMFRNPDYPVHALRQSQLLDLKKLPLLL